MAKTITLDQYLLQSGGATSVTFVSGQYELRLSNRNGFTHNFVGGVWNTLKGSDLIEVDVSRWTPDQAPGSVIVKDGINQNTLFTIKFPSILEVFE